MLGTTETRGANILAAIQVAKVHFGASVVERVVDTSIQASLGVQASSHLVSLKWYPSALYADFLQGLLAASAGRELRAMEALGHDLVARDFEGPYGVIARVFTPNMLVSWGPRAFARYYRGGEVAVQNVAANRSETHFNGWPEFNTPLWETIRGGIRAAISACGKPVTVQLRERGRGAATFSIAWKA